MSGAGIFGIHSNMTNSSSRLTLVYICQWIKRFMNSFTNIITWVPQNSYEIKQPFPLTQITKRPVKYGCGVSPSAKVKKHLLTFNEHSYFVVTVNYTCTETLWPPGTPYQRLDPHVRSFADYAKEFTHIFWNICKFSQTISPCPNFTIW